MPCTLILVRRCASVTSYGFRRQNEKRGNEGRIREVHPKKKRKKKRKILPAIGYSCLFVCFYSMQMHLKKIISKFQTLR